MTLARNTLTSLLALLVCLSSSLANAAHTSTSNSAAARHSTPAGYFEVRIRSVTTMPSPTTTMRPPASRPTTASRTDTTTTSRQSAARTTRPSKTSAPSKTSPSETSAPTTTRHTHAPNAGAATNPLAAQPFYVYDWTFAAQAHDADPSDKAMALLAAQPTALWVDPGSSDLTGYIHGYVAKAVAANAMPVLTVYGIPHRDCGSYSDGGAATSADYSTYVAAVADGIRGVPTAIILEPDALPMLTQCLDGDGQTQRVEMIKSAVTTLTAAGGIVYLDAGTPEWNSAQTMADRLRAAGVTAAAGFSLNVSNFFTTSTTEAYGRSISALLEGKHFVVDTSRNGNGPTDDRDTCNPPGRALGALPTAQTDDALVDAYLWIKYPGSSDGACNGGPAAGQWFPAYATALYANSRYAQ